MKQQHYLQIDVLPVTCPLCGESLTKITRDHAIIHGYKSLTEYRKDNGINYLTLAQRSRENFKRLYNIDFSKYVSGYMRGDEMVYGRKTFVGGKAEVQEARRQGMKSASFAPLNDSNFNNHFKGANPLAIFAYGTHARYFGFDVDSKDKAEGHTFRIVNTLKAEGVSERDIHVSFSGGKGYHVELFTDKHLRFKDWELFAKYVLDKADLSGEAVEWRPNRTNGHAWKLPLTFHPKTKNFAGYCDVNTLKMYDIMESHDYLNDIKLMDAAPVFTILEKAHIEAERIEREEIERKQVEAKERREQRKAVKVTEVDLFQTSEEKEESAKKLLMDGLPGTGTRWKAMRNVLMPYLKIELGNDKEETRRILIEWTDIEINKGNVTTPRESCISEIDELIETWYPQVNGFYSTVREIEVMRGEIDWVLSVVENGGSRNARDLLWALLLMSKAYGKSDRTFFASREQVQKLLSKPKKISPITIQKQRQWLADNGYLTFHVPENFYQQRKATEYQLTPSEESEAPEVIDSITFSEDADGRQLLNDIAVRLYTPKALKKLKVS